MGCFFLYKQPFKKANFTNFLLGIYSNLPMSTSISSESWLWAVCLFTESIHQSTLQFVPSIFTRTKQYVLHGKSFSRYPLDLLKHLFLEWKNKTKWQFCLRFQPLRLILFDSFQKFRHQILFIFLFLIFMLRSFKMSTYFHQSSNSNCSRRIKLFSLRKIPKFHLISWCGNFAEGHVSA